MTSHSQLVRTSAGDIAGHDRGAGLDVPAEPLGYLVECRFRYAVIDRPPRNSSFLPEDAAKEIRKGIFARPRLNDTVRQTYKAFGHPIAPGKPRSSRPCSSRASTANARHPTRCSCR